ncbi:MAG: hypothetical protein A2X36_16105 [Elusimicrobia bacterium GWA2_69_24]|nr:MAG: hypothetical protein A2X36_16105 [Elusimicrobia bacterium GWA2_69_24]
MKAKSLLGWLILLGALAVPAVLFYQWWTQMQKTTTFEAKQKVPEGGAFEGVRSGQEGAGAPGAPEASGAPDGAAPSAPAVPAAGAPGEAAAAPVAAAATAAGAPPVGAPGAGAVAPAPASPAPSGPARSDGKARIEYSPKTTRDPTLSLADLRELAKQKYLKEMNRRDMIEAAKPKELKRPSGPTGDELCAKIDLQGLIGTPDGSAAIINDEVRHVGDRVGGLEVKHITTRTVVFAQGKRTVCVKRVSR